MPSAEDDTSNSGPGSTESAPRDPPQFAPEGFLFYAALGYVIAVAVCNTSLFRNFDPRSMSEESLRWYAFMFGVFGGEAGLLAIAAVLGKGPVWLRMVLVFGVALFWISSAFAAAPWANERGLFDRLQMLGLTFLFFPLSFLSVQLPLWIFRILLRWRIEPLGDLVEKRKPQLSIAGILAFTTAVAVTIGLINVASVVSPELYEDRETLWDNVGELLLTSMIASLLTTVPLAAFALRPRNGWIGAGLTALWALSFTGLITLTLLGQHDVRDRSMRAGITFAGVACSMTAPLFLLRRWKYRLRWGRE